MNECGGSLQPGAHQGEVDGQHQEAQGACQVLVARRWILDAQTT